MELESIKKIATQLDSPNVPEVLESRLKQLSCEQTRITIAGGANVGKTTLINVLANTDLEVSSIPTSKTVRVTYKGKGNSESVDSNSEWLQDKNIEIWELSDAELGNEPTLIWFKQDTGGRRHVQLFGVFETGSERGSERRTKGKRQA